MLVPAQINFILNFELSASVKGFVQPRMGMGVELTTASSLIHPLSEIRSE